MSLRNDQYRTVFVERNGLLSADEFDRVVALSQKTRRPLEQLLTERALITPPQFLQLLESYFEVPGTNLPAHQIDLTALQLLPEDFATKNLAIAFAREEGGLSVALEDPSDKSVIDQIERLIYTPLKPFVALKHDLQQALILYKGEVHERINKAAKPFENPTEASASVQTNSSATALLESLLDASVLLGASDIHLEPFETELLVRFRIDGQLQTIATVPRAALEAVMARIKVLANMKVDQKRLPQDGRFSQRVKEQEINFRVSTVPSLWGEKAVLRVLAKEAHLYDLTTIGLQEKDLHLVMSYLGRPHGMVLVTGPTGSGKTTTLYSFLQEIGRERIDVVNVSTIEDPIEYTIPRITQIQTQPEIDLTFASGLRALLRQDPDILMVGEIRDEETADFAVRAALVGRLLLSSLHTNDAPSAIPRILDMGIEPYLLSSVLMLVVAQRLARKLCTYCRESYHPDTEIIKDLNEHHNFKAALDHLKKLDLLSTTSTKDLRFYKAQGCEHCENTGYKGRTGVFEILEITPHIGALISQRKDSGTLRDLAVAAGMKTMFEDGVAKLLAGEIDLTELLQAVYS
jgi:type IV pilus assembly protein PilB